MRRLAICQGNRAATSASRQHKSVVNELSPDGLIGVFLPSQLAAETGVARTTTELPQGFQKTLTQRFAHHSSTTPSTFLVAGRPATGVATVDPSRDTRGAKPQASVGGFRAPRT